MIPHGTEEWAAARLGKVTASRIADLLARTKTGWGASRDNYMADLIAERLTGVAAEGFKSAAMQWGSDTEHQARRFYELIEGVSVGDGGYLDHPTIPMAGASPDGFAGDTGLVEIKCPLTKTHIDTLMHERVNGAYVKQMQWQMACTGREWCDFISFDPRMPEDLRMFVQRVPRDGAVIAEIEAAVTDFLAELDAKVDALQARRMAA